MLGSDLQLNNPQLKVVLDRDRASAMGDYRSGNLATPSRGSVLSAYATRQVSTINTPNNQYQVIPELDPKFQNDPSALSLLNIRSTTGQAGTAQPMVPLGALATLAYNGGSAFGEPLGTAAIGDRYHSICAKAWRSAMPSNRSINWRARLSCFR